MLVSFLMALVWTTSIRWALPLQECNNNKVKVFWLTIPLDPIGWVRDFAFEIGFINLTLMILITIFFAIELKYLGYICNKRCKGFSKCLFDNYFAETMKFLK